MTALPNIVASKQPLAGSTASYEPSAVQDLDVCAQNRQQCSGRHLFCHASEAVWCPVIQGR